jgi:hypothetical protein
VARFTHPLEHVRVAAPCPASWERMHGDERVRFCAQCNLNVYNLSALTKREAERLVTSTEGRLCVRFYRRADGTILTQNCPEGLRALKRRVSRLVNAVLSAALSFCAGVGLYSWVGVEQEPISPLMEQMPQAAPPAVQYSVMGALALDESARWAHGRASAVAMGEMVRR